MAKLDEVPGCVLNTGTAESNCNAVTHNGGGNHKGEWRMILAEIGMCLFFFGSCLMDSADLKIPAIFCIAGLTLTGLGILKGGKA